MGEFIEKHYHFLFGICLTAIVILSFYVGILHGKREGDSAVVLSCSDEILQSLRISAPQLQVGSTAASKVSDPTTGRFAGSKNGTKYYTPGCAGLDRIKPENLIWFQSVEDATLQGYTAAACYK